LPLQLLQHGVAVQFEQTIQGHSLDIAQPKVEQENSHDGLAGGEGEERLHFRRLGRRAGRHDQRPAGEQKEELLRPLKDADRKETKPMAHHLRRDRVCLYGPLELPQPSLAFGLARHSWVALHRRAAGNGLEEFCRREVLRGVGVGRLCQVAAAVKRSQSRRSRSLPRSGAGRVCRGQSGEHKTGSVVQRPLIGLASLAEIRAKIA
jgi:hypothetical protein